MTAGGQIIQRHHVSHRVFRKVRSADVIVEKVTDTDEERVVIVKQTQK